MRTIRRSAIRLFTSLVGRRDEQRLREELEDHLAREAADHARGGLTDAEARRQAAIAFGSVEDFKERYRDAQTWPQFERLMQDARLALRRMKQAPGFTAAAVGILALGLGLNSAILSLAYGLFLRPLPVEDPTRIVLIERRFDGDTRPTYPIAFPDYLNIRDHATTIPELAAHYSTSPMQVVTRDGPRNVMGSVATANYFSVLRLQPSLGRFFTADEDTVPGRNAVAVVSHEFWQTALHADAAAIGTTVRINGTTFTVIGVTRPDFRGVITGLESNEVWIPSAMFAVGYRYCNGLARGCNTIGLLGRLAPGASVADAQSEIAVLVDQLSAAFPTNRGRAPAVRVARGIRLDEQVTNRPIVALLAGAAGLLLLVVAANVAGLLLARGLKRRKEIAIRLALGASRGRVVRLLLVESVVLAVAGGLVGLAVAVWSTGLMRPFFGRASGGTLNLDLSLEPLIVAGGLLVAVVTGIVAGVAPALQATRNTAPAMKEESAGAGTARSLLREGLIVVQVALSVLILGGSGLLVRSFFEVQKGPGFDPNAVIVTRLRPSLVGSTNDRAWAYQREVLRRLEAQPGVVAASPADVPPFPGWNRRGQPMQLASDTSDPAQAYLASTTVVGARYFKTLGVNVIEGREFDDRDAPGSSRVAIVNETLARHFWPNGGAVGSVATIGRNRVEIVGVVTDAQWLSAVDEPQPIAYLNYWQQDRSNSWSQDSRTHIRIAGSAAARLPEIRRAIASVDPDVPITDAQILGHALDIQFASVRAVRAMLVTFGALALLLSGIGLYAALAFAVGQRTREIAIRLALGAAHSDVGRLIFRRGAIIVALGLSAGLAAAVALAGPLLASLLYGVSPREPVALLAGPCVLAAVALVAIWAPARRAMRLNPVVALRTE